LCFDRRGRHSQPKRAALARNRDIEKSNAESGARPEAGTDLTSQGSGDFGPALMVLHAPKVGIRFGEHSAAGIDPRDPGARSFRKLRESVFVQRKHESDGTGFLRQFLTQFLGERPLHSLSDQIIDRNEREGENRQQAQNELTEDARGQDLLSHRGAESFGWSNAAGQRI
jgi:hypothetical protein